MLNDAWDLELAICRHHFRRNHDREIHIENFLDWHWPNVEFEPFKGLLIEYVERRSAQAVMRGLRAVSDFEFEFQLALMNRKLNERVETIFMMPKDTYTFLSSRIVKEIAGLGGDVSSFVPAHVQAALTAKLRRKSKV